MADYTDGYKDGMNGLIKALMRIATLDPTDQIKYLGFEDMNIDSCYEGLCAALYCDPYDILAAVTRYENDRHAEMERDVRSKAELLAARIGIQRLFEIVSEMKESGK